MRTLAGLASVLVLSSRLAEAGSLRTKDALLERPYPVVAYASFPGGLFHWVDSLAGTSVGKTIPAHREDYIRRFGPITRDDDRHLRAFAEARAAHRAWVRAQARRNGGPAFSSAMLGTFCASATIDEALEVVKSQIETGPYEGLASALAWFRERYERVWAGGVVPETFLERVRTDPGRVRLERILERMVRFYDVAPKAVRPPRVALVPVPAGYGTHAEAIGDILLLEIRPGEGLADQACVLVHENAHFLWGLVPTERQRRLGAYMRGLGAAAAWSLFREALPTALGQGVADRSFRPSEWSIDEEWYHTREVDGYAKRIYPAVRSALESGDPLDEAFLRRAVEALGSRPGVTPPQP